MGSRNRKLAALLAVAWAVVQPGARSPLLAGVWSLGHGEGGPAHSLALAADAGHIDLVVSHAHAGDCERSGAVSDPDRTKRAGELACCRASDHVVHLTVDPAARETGHAQAAAPQRAQLAAFAFVPSLAASAWPAPLPGVSELLRTVVLRA